MRQMFNKQQLGGGANLWKAVKIAKNLNQETIPENLTLTNTPVAPGTAAECFAGHFSEKIFIALKCARNGNN